MPSVATRVINAAIKLIHFSIRIGRIIKSPMPELRIRISPQRQRQVNQRVANGDFPNADAYVEALLVRDAARDKRRQLEQRLLKRIGRKGAIEMNESDFASMRSRFMSAIRRVRKQA
jgi:Arc/MetJ-type ribon-helix-helix transcriptional regulator